MAKTLTPAQVTAVAEVQASIDAATALRLANKVVETPNQTADRVAQEAFDIKVASGLVHGEELEHHLARKQRVVAALSTIAANISKTTTQGLTLEQGALALAKANVLNVIEPLVADSSTVVIASIIGKTNEIIGYINATASVMGITPSVLSAAMNPVLPSILAQAASIISVASVASVPSVLA